MIKKIISLLFLAMAYPVSSQNAEMADTMRADGKIYVVIAVIALIFVSLAVYLAVIDRRLGRIEKEITGHRNTSANQAIDKHTQLK